MIDLHCHSTFSDGSCTPAQLVEMAHAAGLTALALTDHDSTNGIESFMAACARPVNGKTLLGVPGVEISADIQKGTMHVLGYFLDTTNGPLQEVLTQIRDGREIRNRKIVAQLQAMGMAITWDEVRSYAGEDVVGRPHFSRALIDKGYVKDNDEAFERYLAKGKPGYADRFRLTPEASIGVILAAGGVPVLSHPFTLELDSKALREYIKHLKNQGLQGMEVHYPEHGPERFREYQALARELGLIATGGSDFHGAVNPDVQLGVGFGGLRVPDEIAGELARKRDELRREKEARS